MSTTTTSQQPTNTTDADFRNWATHIHNTFANAGWTQTADTGQINLSTVTKPAASATEQGFEIWKMADALATSYPVYVRIGYGSGGNANNPAIWIEIGTGSDGAGLITGRMWRSLDSGTAAWVGCQFNSAVLAPTPKCYGNGGTSWMGCIMFGDQSSSNYLWAFSISRTKTEAGADSADGVVFFSSSLTTAGLCKAAIFRFDEVNRQPPDTVVNYILDTTNVALAGSLPADGGGVPFSGLYAFHGYAYPWDGTWMVMRSNYGPTTATALVTAAARWGVRSKFLLQSGLTVVGLGGNDTNSVVGLYWGAV